MADWYVRPDASHGGTNAGTSYANAWQGWASIVWAGAGIVAGDTLYVCGNFARTTATSMANPHGGTSSSPVKIRGDYAPNPGIFSLGSGGFLYITRSWTEILNLTISSSVTTGSPIYIENCDGITVSGNTISGGGTAVSVSGAVILTYFKVTGNHIYGQNISAVGYNLNVSSSTASGINISGNTIHDSNQYGIFVGVSGAGGTTSRVNDVQIRDNTIYNTKEHPIYFDGTTVDPFGATPPTVYSWGLEITGNTVYDCGVIAGAGGKHGGLGVNGAIFPLIFDNDIRNCYVTGGGIQTAQNMYAMIFDNTISGIRSGTPTSGFQNGLPIDGNGIFFDNQSNGGIAFGNHISDLVTTGNVGSGAALAFWDCQNCTFTGNIVEDVACVTIYGDGSESGNKAYNNTAVRATVAVQKVGSVALAGSFTVKNNILKDCVTCFSIGANPSITADYNRIHGSTTIYSGITAGPNDTYDDPELDADYRPKTAVKGEYLGGKDFYGKHFRNQPTIGAVEEPDTPRFVLRR